MIANHQPESLPANGDRTTPDWLQVAVDGIYDIQRRSLPPWLKISELPPIVIGGTILSSVQVQSLLVALEGSTLEHIHPLVLNVKTHAQQETLDAFVCKLFDLWRLKGKAIKDKWAFLAMGLLGSDMAAHKLGPLVYTWRNELKHQYVSWGLECLKAIGNPAALMELHAIAQKTRHAALKQKVQAFLADIAQQLNLTQDELQDRIIPDCGLDERGNYTFDFGTRQFQFVLGRDLKPMVRDITGKLKPNLPKPGARDQADLANQAIAEWKVIKKQINQTFKIQSTRLEQAMVLRRRWQPNQFETLFVHHPLMTHLVQSLVWGSYDTSGQLMTTFRVTEDQAYATIEDENYEIVNVTSVGVIHPLELTVDRRFSWSELFSDYEILQPFPQLGRPLYELEPGEAEQTEITRFASTQVEAIALVSFLDRQGWVRGCPQDGGCIYEHFKVFEQANITAFIQYDGVPVYAVINGGMQSIPRCFFMQGSEPASCYPDLKSALSLNQVNPIVLSEVLGDVMAIAAKSK